MASEETRNNFDKRLTILQDLVSLWEQGKQAEVVESKFVIKFILLVVVLINRHDTGSDTDDDDLVDNIIHG